MSLSSFKTYLESTSSTSSQAAQTAQLVILNIGGKTFRGNGTSLDGQECHYVVGFKDNVCISYWASSADNTYSFSLVKTVENNVYNALPADIKACFKKFDVVTGVYNGYASGETNVTSQQYFTSPAEKEIFGTGTHSTSNETNALSQFTYYETADNRIKKSDGSTAAWWERSPTYDSYSKAGVVSINGEAGYNWFPVNSELYGVSPFGCI